MVTNAVNIAAVRPEAMEALAPFVPLCEKLGRLAQGLGQRRRSTASRSSSTAGSPSTTPGCSGSRSWSGSSPGHTEEPVNLVNAPAMAEERGIELSELKEAASDDFTELIRCGGPAASGRGRRHGRRPAQRPYLVGVWGQSFYMPFADHLAIFRYADQPGMIGRVGTAFGEHGVNIVSAAVGAESAATARR